MNFRIKKIDIILPLIIAAAVIIICRETFITGEPLRPGNDSYHLDFPFRLLAWESIRNFEWPLWNPYNSGGVNLIGQPFFFLLYPLYWITYLFDKSDIFYILSLTQIFHLIAAGTGMYFLLRKLVKGEALIALWGALLYTFSYPVLDAFVIGQLLVSYVFLPWIILSFYTLQKRNLPANLLILSLLIFLMVGGGFTQWNLFTLIIIFLFLVLRYRPWAQGKKLLYGIGIFFAAGIIAFLLGGIELLPFLEQNAVGARSHATFSAILKQRAVPWFFSLRLLVPNLFSSDLRSFTSDPEIFLEDTFNSYYGAAAFVLTILALTQFKKKQIITWGFLFVFIFFAALGTEQFKAFFFILFMKADMVYTRVGSLLPFIGIILSSLMLKLVVSDRKKMARLLILMAITAACILALQTSQAVSYLKTFLIKPELDEAYLNGQVLLAFAIIAAYLAVFLIFHLNLIGKKTLLVSLCVFALIEVSSLSLRKDSQYFSVRHTREYFGKTKGEKILEDVLDGKKNRFRVHNTSVRFGDLTSQLGGSYLHYFPNSNIFNKFYEVNGYILNMQKDMGQIMTNTKGGYFIRMADLLTYGNLPTLLSIRYVITRRDIVSSKLLIDPAKSFKTLKDFTDGQPGGEYKLKVIEIDDIPPRFYFTKQIESVQDRGVIFDRIMKPSFDPRKKTYFEDAIEQEGFDTQGQKVLDVSVPSANQVIVRTDAKTPGLLVANNFHHSWWRVEVNGEPARLYRVNFLFQGVYVPAGVSTIRFYCKALSLEIGKYISLTGVAIIILLAVYSFKKRRNLIEPKG